MRSIILRGKFPNSQAFSQNFPLNHLNIALGVDSAPLQVALIGYPHPGRNVAAAVQHPPDIDVIIPLDIEHEMGVTLHLPAAQTRQVEFMGIARRAGRGMTLDVQEGLLECVDKLQRSLFRACAEIVIDCLMYVLVSPGAQDGALEIHCLPRRLTRLRRPSK